MNELRSPAYWVGHFFTIAATIVGVYYAAIVGFDTALKLDLVKADRGTYYVAESMYQELDFNVKNMDKYIERVKKERYVYKEHLAGIKLNDYVFQAAKYSESTFELEPKLLTEVSIYYFSVGNAIKNYYDSGMKSPSSLMSVVKRETKKLKKQKTLERLAAYNKALAKTVEDRGVSLTQPSFKL
ncbi:hypothetical protein [Sulfurospirillum arcachonense]|uniref:hypothetical protein n=1 Tax=Sulfurospirillum arcachonense TaxID=57666 RepID=UPI00046B0993|nr:hypothetical protein [Sulfurospirillum arcachonense]